MEMQTHSKMRVNSLVLLVAFDLTDRTMYVQFEDEEATHEFNSEDGNYTAFVRFDPLDNIPTIVGLTFRDAVRFGVIEEWIAEACEITLEQYEDNYARGAYQVVAREGAYDLVPITQIGVY